jgi:hypothetical protein
MHVHGSLADDVTARSLARGPGSSSRRARLDPKRRFTGGAAFVGREACPWRSAVVPCQHHFRSRAGARPPHGAQPVKRERRRRTARAVPAKPPARARESGLPRLLGRSRLAATARSARTRAAGTRSGEKTARRAQPPHLRRAGETRARAAARTTSSAGEAPCPCTGVWRARRDRRAARTSLQLARHGIRPVPLPCRHSSCRLPAAPLALSLAVVATGCRWGTTSAGDPIHLADGIAEDMEV